MIIKHMRLVLPSRMRSTAQADARMIAEAAAKALHAQNTQGGSMNIRIDAHGRPAPLLAQDVAKEVRHQSPTRKEGG